MREKLRKLPGGPTQPLTVHLRQEIDRLNIIITLTTTTLKNVRLAIAGMCHIETICQLSCSPTTSHSWNQPSVAGLLTLYPANGDREQCLVLCVFS